MSRGPYSVNSGPRRKMTPAAKRVAEALGILHALRVPKEQQNERSALTLLALLGMTPRKPWVEAEARLPEGRELRLTAGGQNELVKKIVEEFYPRFAPGSVVVYVGDTGTNGDTWRQAISSGSVRLSTSTARCPMSSCTCR